MKNLAIRAFLLCACLLLPVSRAEETFFVSPNGNDAWSGKLPSANAQKTDGPFRSVSRARDEIRGLKGKGPVGPVTVYVRGGRYELDGTMEFAPADSGAEGSPIVYSAYEGETPILSAGTKLTSIRNAKTHWEVDLPAVKQGDWEFSQLFVNGSRRMRSRLPAEGYYYIAGSAPRAPYLAPKHSDAFRYDHRDLRLSPNENLLDIEIEVFHHWSTSKLRVAEIDRGARTISFTGATYRDLTAGSRYLVENTQEGMKMPGQWCLVSSTGTLKYVPLPGENISSVEMVAPRYGCVMEVSGDIEKKQWVEHLVFRGITFAHANWSTPLQGNVIGQAECTLPCGIQAEGMRDCAFEDCRFTQMSSHALELGLGCKRNRIERCEFTDNGGGGIKIGPARSKDGDLIASHNVIRDCLIAHNGRFLPASVGILLQFAHDNVIEHNDVYDMYYTGISAGWTWGLGETPTCNNVIAHNHIHDCLQDVLTDGAGIYTLGRSPGTVIRGNHIHDITGIPWAVGIYLDQGTSFTLSEDNLVYNITTHVYNLNSDGGMENVARNNIFGPILDPEAPMFRKPMYRRGERETNKGFDVQHNIIYWNVGALTRENWERSDCFFDYNLYWNFGGHPVMFHERSFKEWQATGQDTHSIVADPMFMNPAEGDYRPKEGSPASKIGFRPFDYSKAGRITKTAPQAFPRAYPAGLRNPPRRKLDIELDFEDSAVGTIPPMDVHEEGKGTIRVTDATAAGGAKALRFTDAAGIKFYNPHLVLFSGKKFTSGSFRFAADIMNDKERPADIYIEFRDWSGKKILIGPHLTIKSNGKLYLNCADDGNASTGVAFCEVPNGEWFHVEILFTLNPAADRQTYQVTVSQKAEVRARKSDAPFLAPNFKVLSWGGIVSPGQGEARLYIDNLTFKE
ncbi:MAG: right-handed parallel beta-helix repeat-containing protein [Planctomycetota bacterium]